MQILSTDEIAALFGTTKDRLDKESLAHIAACDWGYEPLKQKERDSIIISLLERIENRKKRPEYACPLECAMTLRYPLRVEPNRVRR